MSLIQNTLVQDKHFKHIHTNPALVSNVHWFAQMELAVILLTIFIYVFFDHFVNISVSYQKIPLVHKYKNKNRSRIWFYAS